MELLRDTAGERGTNIIIFNFTLHSQPKAPGVLPEVTKSLI